ncbi:MAG: bifunctional UDP-N-acetylmuramoyl-tripeptide:D-alanyl-D-alanine ligase/alanine racemase [Bacteroidales bacterium]|nr:bifunctional UDP-N-acetylmuramoyl-tripeptide:D-alanyl-D-alanine ligase/alanine racemase [Bacteroidales bacterium]
MTYTLQQIEKILNACLKGNEGEKINYVVFDSRMILPSLNSLFFALKTKQNDGHNYIADLYSKGLRNFVVNNDFSEFNSFQDANFICVENTTKALQNFAAHHRKQFDIPVVAVTGSNGKTIVKEWFTILASKYKKVLQSPKSYNSQIGVPLSVLELKENHEIAIFEAGISKIGEMSKLATIISPKIGIFTNIGDAHQENFPDIQTKVNEKLELFKNCEIIIYSSDKEEISNSIKSTYPNKKTFTWGKNKNSDLQLVSISQRKGFTYFELIFKKNIYSFSLKFIDNASLENTLTVLSTLLVVFPDKKPDDFDLHELHSVEMRLQQIEGKNNCTIINDSYNCDLASLRIALDVLNAQNQHTKKTLILSDIFEVGTEEKTLYKTVANLLINSNISRIIGVGETISKFADFFNIEKYFFEDTQEFISNLNSLGFKNEAILLKGARKYRFELISNELQLKSHRTVLEINLSSFEHNLQYFKSLLLPKTKLMIMVKAFSYGSGSFEIANYLKLKNVDYLAVAIADEGIELRKAGIKTPILILNPDIENIDLFINYTLEPEIYSFRILDDFYKAVKNRVHNPYPIHIKLNTGMNRLGFSKDEIPDLLEKLKSYDRIFVKSVFSHLVASGDENFDSFTKKQILDFKQITLEFEENLGYRFMRHILNSGGIERFPDAQFDMVRLGIGLYGISSKSDVLVKNISRLKTQIIQKIKVKAGETIGYNRAGKVERDSVIATLPIGYADGLRRKFSNGVGKVKIKGKFVPIIGNICMDLTMIDITDIEAEEGDEVIIFDEDYSVAELAEQLETIAYEVLTSISPRVKRVYVWE